MLRDIDVRFLPGWPSVSQAPLWCPGLRVPLFWLSDHLWCFIVSFLLLLINRCCYFKGIFRGDGSWMPKLSTILKQKLRLNFKTRLILRKNSQWKENEIRPLLSCLGGRAACESLADRHKLSSSALHGSLINSSAWVWGGELSWEAHKDAREG